MVFWLVGVVHPRFFVVSVVKKSAVGAVHSGFLWLQSFLEYLCWLLSLPHDFSSATFFLAKLAAFLKLFLKNNPHCPVTLACPSALRMALAISAA